MRLPLINQSPQQCLHILDKKKNPPFSNGKPQNLVYSSWRGLEESEIFSGTICWCVWFWGSNLGCRNVRQAHYHTVSCVLFKHRSAK